MKQPGKKSAAKLAVVPRRSAPAPRPLPPTSLDKPAAELWRNIVDAYPADHFGPGDLPLLREYCVTSETYLPEANAAAEAGGPREAANRTMHVKTLMTLASKLRLNVSARSRPDAAAITKAHRGGGRGLSELARQIKAQEDEQKTS